MKDNLFSPLFVLLYFFIRKMFLPNILQTFDFLRILVSLTFLIQVNFTENCERKAWDQVNFFF